MSLRQNALREARDDYYGGDEHTKQTDTQGGVEHQEAVHLRLVETEADTEVGPREAHLEGLITENQLRISISEKSKWDSLFALGQAYAQASLSGVNNVDDFLEKRPDVEAR